MTTDFLELGWKSTVILTLAAIVAYAMRTQSAGARHLVWKLACLSLLVLPAGQAWMPGWNVLPEKWFMVSFDPSLTEPRAIAATHNPPDTVAKNQAVSTEPAQARIPTNPFPDPVSTPNVRVRTREETVIVGGEPRIFRPIDRVEMPSAILWRFNAVLRWVVVLWGSIACLLMLRLLASVLMLWRKTSQLPMMTHEPLLTLVASLRSDLSLKQTVDVRFSTPETMPMVWGLWHPVIIVPETITSWPIEQQRSVLLHELAHVKRRDPLWQVVVELTKVIYWPQPVLWLALRQIERLREQACDDLVLNSGVSAADYARSLLDVVSQGRLRRIWPAVGVAIVSTPSIEMRLKTILDRTVNRFAVSRRMAMIVVIAAISTTVILTSFRLTVPSIVDEPIAKDSLTKAVIQVSPKQEENPVEEKPVEVAPLQKERRQIVLEFYGEDGKPVQGAKVDIVGLRTLVNHASSYGWSDKFHGSKPVDVSNEKGEITIDFPEFVLEQMRTSVLLILVTHPEFAAKNHELDLLKQNRRDAPVYLTRQRVPLQRGVVYQISFAGENTPVRPMSTLSCSVISGEAIKSLAFSRRIPWYQVDATISRGLRKLPIERNRARYCSVT
ncbi:M56 family metallopeptidase [Lacunimicrobium album]